MVNGCALLSPKVVTSGEFIAAVFAELSLRGQKAFSLKCLCLDDRFEKAYDWLEEKSHVAGFTTNFSIYTSILHGDSATLRDTISELREREILKFTDKGLWNIEFSRNKEEAEKILARSAIPSKLLAEIVDDNFSPEHSPVSIPRYRSCNGHCPFKE